MNGLEQRLIAEYPTARPGFVKILVQALELHAKKNHDYNGTSPLFTPDIKSLYYDLRRKFSRLHNLITENAVNMVDEKLEDTVMDLGVYSLLMAEEISNNLTKGGRWDTNK